MMLSNPQKQFRDLIYNDKIYNDEKDNNGIACVYVKRFNVCTKKSG